MLSKKLFLLYAVLFAMLSASAQPFINEVRAFAKQDSMAKPPEGAILLIGSSSFTKWKDVGDYFPDKTIELIQKIKMIVNSMKMDEKELIHWRKRKFDSALKALKCS